MEVSQKVLRFFYLFFFRTWLNNSFSIRRTWLVFFVVPVLTGCPFLWWLQWRCYPGSKISMVVSSQYANYLTKMFVQSVIKAQTGTTVSFGIAESAEKVFLLCVISIFIQQGNISFRDDFFLKTSRSSVSLVVTCVGCRKHGNPYTYTRISISSMYWTSYSTVSHESSRGKRHTTFNRCRAARVG